MGMWIWVKKSQGPVLFQPPLSSFWLRPARQYQPVPAKCQFVPLLPVVSVVPPAAPGHQWSHKIRTNTRMASSLLVSSSSTQSHCHSSICKVRGYLIPCSCWTTRNKGEKCHFLSQWRDKNDISNQYYICMTGNPIKRLKHLLKYLLSSLTFALHQNLSIPI